VRQQAIIGFLERQNACEYNNFLFEKKTFSQTHQTQEDEH